MSVNIENSTNASKSRVPEKIDKKTTIYNP